jgi:hypothetical protein
MEQACAVSASSREAPTGVIPQLPLHCAADAASYLQDTAGVHQRVLAAANRVRDELSAARADARGVQWRLQAAREDAAADIEVSSGEQWWGGERA